VSPVEYKEYQAAHRRKIWRRNLGYIRTYAVRGADAVASVLVWWRRNRRNLGYVGRLAGRGAAYAVCALIVWWCGLEWWWFFHK
jgi:hypothetical protein